MDDTVERARAAWRRGRYREALAHLDARADRDALDAGAVLRAELLRLVGQVAASAELAERVVQGARGERSWVLAEAMRILGRARITLGEAGGADSALQHARDLFRDLGDAAGVARCQRDLGTIRDRRGDPRGAEAALADALRTFRALGDVHELGYTLNAHGNLLRAQGDHVGAAAAFEQSSEALAAVGDDYGYARSLDGLAHLALSRGDTELALAHGRRLVAIFEGLGYAGGVAGAWNLLGESHRARGELEQAEEAYRRALAAFPGLGEEAFVLRINVALVVLERGHYADAEVLLVELVERLEPARERLMLGLCELYLLPCVAARADWAQWDARWMRGTALLAESGVVDRDVARCARLAGQLASSVGIARALARAASAHALALDLWTALGAADEADVERGHLRALADRGAPIPLGPFDLVAPLGQGAMGEVWRARHRAQGVEVAIKVLAGSLEPKLQKLLQDEVAAVAALDHPHVVRVLDTGEVSRAAEVLAAGRLVAGNAWVAMELAPGGTLQELCGTLPWPACRQLLLALLDALAHAHARGVVHFDLKPANVLLDGASPPSPRLSDFGLAAAFRAFDHRRIVLGTPAYMAPEQFSGDRRAYGPWTDLYGLGCLAWELVTGAPPFEAPDVAGLRAAHERDPVPKLAAAVPVPVGLEEWLGHLLEKDPKHRFRRAADAAWALTRLGEATGHARPKSAPGLASSSTIVLTGWDGRTDVVVRSQLDAEALQGEVPPLPQRWRPPAESEPPVALIGAGLRLTALRSVPLVGREREQDQLWAALCDVAARRRGRVVVASGPPGIGKSRLLGWLAERAHELGAATIVRLSGGLQASLAALLKTDGLAEPAIAEQLGARLLGRRDRALERRLAAAIARGEGLVEATLALLDRLGERRAVIVVADGVTDDVLALASAIPGSPRPVLVAAVDDALRLGGEVLALGPLAPEAHAALVARLLWLEPEVARAVAEATDGNPAYAGRLVDDLARRGLLAPTSSGYALVEGARLELPDDLFAAWSPRVDELVAGLVGAEPALAVAAALGELADAAGWERGCADAGLGPPPTLLLRLRAAGLVADPRRSLRFADPMLRDAVLRRAQEAGRMAQVHRVCAATLVRAGRRTDPSLGRHLLGAGELLAALDPLMGAARGALKAGAPRRARALLADREEALRTLVVPTTDPRWSQQLLTKARVARELGELAAMEDAASLAVELGRAGGWPSLARALALRAEADHLAGRPDVALAGFREAAEEALAVGDARTVAPASLGEAAVHLSRGALAKAERAFRAALEAWEARGGSPAAALVGLGAVARARGAGGDTLLSQALTRAGSDAAARCGALLGLAALARDAGEHDVAEAHVLAAKACARGPLVHRVEVAEALNVAARGDLAGLATRLVACDRVALPAELRDHVDALWLLLDPPDAAERRTRVEVALDHRERADVDLAWVLERVGAAGGRARWAAERAAGIRRTLARG